MTRDYYSKLASSGLRMPIATHLVLHEHPDAAAIVLDGERLGRVYEETARRYGSPLAIPLMDLTLEKSALLSARGIPQAEVDSFHFDSPPKSGVPFQATPRMLAACGAVRYIASSTELLPVGMLIGPFSFMTKLIADPIAPVFLAGDGATAEDEPEVAVVEAVIELALETILAYLNVQIEAGAKAIFVCEPAANKVYFSPTQLEASFEIFDRYVMAPNRKVKALLDSHGVDLIFHNCGELTDEMVRRFDSLNPALLSLGSSRKLWEDAALLQKTTVLYGNLPSKHFYSDTQMSVEKVEAMTSELLRKMRPTGHPFILGSECDILNVPNCEKTIRSKVDAFMGCQCAGSSGKPCVTAALS